mgnify:CR=1 FL=1
MNRRDALQRITCTTRCSRLNKTRQNEQNEKSNQNKQTRNYDFLPVRELSRLFDAAPPLVFFELSGLSPALSAPAAAASDGFSGRGGTGRVGVAGLALLSAGRFGLERLGTSAK